MHTGHGVRAGVNFAGVRLDPWVNGGGGGM